MYTISLKEAKKQALQILKYSDSKRDDLLRLIELTYKSGKHDGWYEHQDKLKRKANS